MPADLTEINAIVRHRYETGECGHAHFEVSEDVLAEMRAYVPNPPVGQHTRSWLGGDPLGDLMAIQVVVDDELPPATWQLVDNSSGDVLAEGRTDGE